MGKRIDLTGQRFGRLVVLGFSCLNKHNKSMWLCKCNCGTTKIITGCHLKSSATKSCGCLVHKKPRNFINLTGQRFGKLVVIGEDNKNRYKITHWLCKCDCGNKTTVAGHHLKNGHTKSCGCSHHRTGKDNPSYNPNLTDEDRIRGRNYPEYKEWRKAVYKRDNYTCQVCGQIGGNLNAHHLESYHNNPDLRTKLSNGATVCDKCHGNFHHSYSYHDNTKKQFNKFKLKKE